MKHKMLFTEEELQTAESFVLSGGYGRVGVQGDDSSLSRAAALTAALQQRLPGVRFAVVGEAAYGSCCADTVCAQHFGCHALLLTGVSCCTALNTSGNNNNIATLLLPPSAALPPLPSLSTTAPAVVLLHPSLSCSDPLLTDWAARHAAVIVPNPTTLTAPQQQHEQHDDNFLLLLGRRVPLPLQALVYVSCHHDDPAALLLALEASARRLDFSFVSPRGVQDMAQLASSAFFLRRKAQMDRLRDAAAVGVLCGSLAPADTVSRMRDVVQMLRQSGRTPYCVVAGRATREKLMNFSAVRVWVCLGCPLATLRLSAALASPLCAIVTPLELRVALEGPWRPLYLTTDAPLPPSPSAGSDLDDDDNDDDDVVEGDDRRAPIAGVLVPAPQLQMVQRASPAALHLRAPGRWVGLDPNVAQDEAVVGPPVQGRSGTASGYSDEHELNLKN